MRLLGFFQGRVAAALRTFLPSIALPANILLTSALLTTVALDSQASANYQPTSFTIDQVGEKIVAVDMNGDGRKDFIVSDEHHLRLFLQRENLQEDENAAPFDFKNPNAELNLPGKTVGWDVDYAATSNPRDAKRVLALVDGKQVLSWSLEQGGFGEPKVELDEVNGYLPLGAYPLQFVRDINGDKRNDLVIPGAGALSLFLRKEGGGYENPVPVKTSLWVNTQLPSDVNLQAKLGQRVRIPLVRVRDVNNDERNDLLSWNNNVLEVYLAKEAGRFAESPSYRFDGNEVAARVGEVDVDKIDYSNLSALLAHSWQTELEDMDGDKIEDLLVREGGKITLYGGEESGMNFTAPRQVLKSSGNVLAAVLVDEDGDGAKDLWIMRIEPISIGNVFMWLAVSGSIDIETFVYKNQGERFASRPSRKITLTVKFPSILKSVDMVSSAADSAQQTAVWRSARAELDKNQSLGDLVQLRGTSLALFLNKIEREQQNQAGIFLPGYRADKDNYVIDLGTVLANPSASDEDYTASIVDATPLHSIDMSPHLPDDFNAEAADLFTSDLNGDGRDDIVVFTERDENRVSGLIYLSR